MSDTAAIKPIILAIDDEQEMVDIIRMTLEEAGMGVLTATLATEGLRLYETRWRQIDLVLLDFLMPDMTGDLVFEFIMRVNPYAKVILLTGGDDQAARRMMEVGLRGCIQKPFYLDDLVERVREQLDAP
jgi:DNA-binding NtrC family response regulator